MFGSPARTAPPRTCTSPRGGSRTALPLRTCCIDARTAPWRWCRLRRPASSKSRAARMEREKGGRRGRCDARGEGEAPRGGCYVVIRVLRGFSAASPPAHTSAARFPDRLVTRSDKAPVDVAEPHADALRPRRIRKVRRARATESVAPARFVHAGLRAASASAAHVVGRQAMRVRNTAVLLAPPVFVRSREPKASAAIRVEPAKSLPRAPVVAVL